MKKLFNHTKRPAEDWNRSNGYDWDEIDLDEDIDLADEAELVEDVDLMDEADLEDADPDEVMDADYSEETVYYGEDGEEYYVAEDGSLYYYGEDGEIYYVTEDGAVYYYGEDGETYYVAEDGSLYYYGEDGEIYYLDSDELYYGADGEEYYEEDGGVYYGEDGEVYYAEEDEYVEEYESGEEYYEEQTTVLVNSKKNKKTGFWADFKEKLVGATAFDRVVATTGIAVLVLALITGSVYISATMINKQVDEFVTVGSQIEDIEVIGEYGLMAVADVRKAKLAAASVIQEEQNTEYNEVEVDKSVTVKPDMVSVKKDLKIKFTNKSSGKLIPNVPFEVTITKPDGKTETWSDDDKDGIIYKKDITPGNYKVLVNKPAGDMYKHYTVPESAQSIEVKKDIAYNKVDVKNEIKTEAEVNAALEDTKKNEIVVESVLEDTVTWVESTATAVTYWEVEKSTIPDPATLAKAGSFVRLSASGNDVTVPAPPTTPVPTPTPPQERAVTLDKSTVSVLAGKEVTINATVVSSATGTVNARTDDEDIAVVSVEGNVVKITGVSAGSVTIRVLHPEDSNIVATCTVTVKDNQSMLKDVNGNQLYVLEGDEYREAVYADYYTAEKFFIRGEAKYTGWQTIDNKLYFFDANGKKVTGEQVIQGAKYNFASDGSLVTDSKSGTMGIDVSKWNGTINWNEVKKSGVSYVIIRVGYRGSSKGALIEDPTFKTNIKGATAAGLKVGVYFFSQAVDEVEAVEEASMVLDRVSGYKISYPIFLDVEPSGGRADAISKSTRTEVCKAFCKTIQNEGYTAGIYANKTWLTEKIDTSALGSYKIWLAQYAATPTYGGRYDMWQYKDTGKIKGISGNVDMNISYLGY